MGEVPLETVLYSCRVLASMGRLVEHDPLASQDTHRS